MFQQMNGLRVMTLSQLFRMFFVSNRNRNEAEVFIRIYFQTRTKYTPLLHLSLDLQPFQSFKINPRISVKWF